MFKIGDLVTRNSYNNDIVFKVMDVDGDLYYLKGINERLVADSPEEDLKMHVKREDDNVNELFTIDDLTELDRDEYFYLPGKVLHIDSDKDYLERCLNFYTKNKVKAYGLYSEENDLHLHISDYLEKYKPNILVVTGHDAFYRKRKDRDKYKNSENFVKTVKEARNYEDSHDKLIIIAGACQSDYEELIKAGANFASSPKRVNIHALDPAIVATSLALSDHNKNIDLINILNKTKYKTDGIGGIITKGTMYIGFPRE